jgi:phosphoribosylformimino-5-aminoimidazole carboxamide ribonucleotide (ProFAR) isomerase
VRSYTRLTITPRVRKQVSLVNQARQAFARSGATVSHALEVTGAKRRRQNNPPCCTDVHKGVIAKF